MTSSSSCGFDSKLRLLKWDDEIVFSSDAVLVCIWRSSVSWQILVNALYDSKERAPLTVLVTRSAQDWSMFMEESEKKKNHLDYCRSQNSCCLWTIFSGLHAVGPNREAVFQTGEGEITSVREWGHMCVHASELTNLSFEEEEGRGGGSREMRTQ